MAKKDVPKVADITAKYLKDYIERETKLYLRDFKDQNFTVWKSHTITKTDFLNLCKGGLNEDDWKFKGYDTETLKLTTIALRVGTHKNAKIVAFVTINKGGWAEDKSYITSEFRLLEEPWANTGRPELDEKTGVVHNQKAFGKASPFTIDRKNPDREIRFFCTMESQRKKRLSYLLLYYALLLIYEEKKDTPVWMEISSDLVSKKFFQTLLKYFGGDPYMTFDQKEDPNNADIRNRGVFWFFDHEIKEIKKKFISNFFSKKGTGAKKTSVSTRAGLQFPAGRIDRYLRVGNYSTRVGRTASIYLAAVMEYIVVEVIELSGNATKDLKKRRITPRHILLAVHGDEELQKLFNTHKTIAGGGVIPKIHKSLIPKKAKKKTTSKSPVKQEESP